MSILLIVADREGESQVALSRGLSIAARLGYAAQVVGFSYESLRGMGITPGEEQARARKKLLARRKTEVEAHIKQLKPSAMRVSCTVIWQKDIHRWLDKQCQRKEYAAVVKTGRRSGSFLYTSTDWHLLRECPAPLMIVAEKKWNSKRPIVAAVDLASKLRVKQRLNQEIIATAKRYAEVLGCPLVVLNVLHIPPILTELDLVDEFTQVRKLTQDLQPKLVKLSRAHGLDLKQFRLKHGPVDKVIASEAARMKAQLVVMGTVGRKGIKAKLMGNTAEKVLGKLRTDVLALKP
jgi:universal stress protein E